MGIAYLVAGFYLLAGATCAFVVDRREMRKDIPYGEVPAIAPLRTIRTAVFFVLTFTATLYLLRGIVVRIRLLLRRQPPV